jgi:hypothetical protein
MRIAILFVLLAGACTSTTELHRPLNKSTLGWLNWEVEGREVDLTWRAPTTATAAEQAQVDLAGRVPTAEARVHADGAEQVRVDSDAVHFVRRGEQREVPTDLLRSLEYLSPDHPRLRGGLQGLAFGTPITVLSLMAWGSSALCEGDPSCTRQAATTALVGLGIGLLVAPAIGALIGHHDEVTLAPP